MSSTKKYREDSYSYSPRKRRSSRSSSFDSNWDRKSRKSRRHRRHHSSSHSSSRSRSGSSSNRRACKRRRYYGTREHPYESPILGVFGLSSVVRSHDLYDFFSHYGPIDDARIIYDRATRHSRGFGFIYFRRVEDAAYARRKCNGIWYLGRRIRVDYSITKRAHTPTPGIYMGYRSLSSSRRQY